MVDDERPAAAIARLAAEREARSDEEILAELSALPALPDEDDRAWDDGRVWRQAYLFQALADVASARQLHPAIGLLLERASYGDPGEMMRGLRHALEGIASPDWDFLADRCAEATGSPRPGARYWAIDELGILRAPRTLPVLIAALDDPVPGVRERALESLRRLAIENDECRHGARLALIAAMGRESDGRMRDHIRKVLDDIAALGTPGHATREP